MLKQIIENTKTIITNIPGYRTNKKIVVIESDDWGSIRVSSKNAYDKFLKEGFPVNECAYNSNDSLESNQDLEILFETLVKFKDKNNSYPKITANYLVANPDFKKIKDSNYSIYFFEPLTETINSYPNSSNIIELAKKGMLAGIFRPQLHGREHIQINNWLKNLGKGDKNSLLAFEEKMFTVSRGVGSSCKRENLDGFGCYIKEEIIQLEKTLLDASTLFENIWGYKSKSIIAPCYTWRPEAEEFFHNIGVEFIQSGRVQTISGLNGQPNTYKRRYTGQKNKLNQIYTMRNATFEPSSNPNKDWIDSCLFEISTAFKWKKPAIISSHRLNFIGSISEMNRTKNINLLNDLLKRVITKWPDVEFMTSDQLGDLIKYRKYE
jgi:hypothetical protein